MPVYKVEHSYPLTRYQKTLLAQHFTELHSKEFLTPSLFVNVIFAQAEQTGDYFLAGKPVTPYSPNRIMGFVRTGPKRTKERFDAFAYRMQEKWYEVVNGPTEEGGAAPPPSVNGASDQQSVDEKKKKKMFAIGFLPIVAVIENGVTIPGADNEGTWLKDNMAYFKEQAEVYGDEDFRDMIQEVHERADLKKLLD